jgi:geranylgeranyl diphosphate/geranylgeranyl-bacteriochlorophyllide a reductase
MISPTGRKVDIPIENGFVGMVDREHFDEFLRVRARKPGPSPDRHVPADRTRRAGTHVVYRDKASGDEVC